MSNPASRIGDWHKCPVCDPKPHVGGPVVGPGCPTVLIGGQPAAAAGDVCTCVGPPDAISEGCPTVLVGNRPIAFKGAKTSHGGSLMQGEKSVTVG